MRYLVRLIAFVVLANLIGCGRSVTTEVKFNVSGENITVLEDASYGYHMSNSRPVSILHDGITVATGDFQDATLWDDITQNAISDSNNITLTSSNVTLYYAEDIGNNKFRYHWLVRCSTDYYLDMTFNDGMLQDEVDKAISAYSFDN